MYSIDPFRYKISMTIKSGQARLTIVDKDLHERRDFNLCLVSAADDDDPICDLQRWFGPSVVEMIHERISEINASQTPKTARLHFGNSIIADYNLPEKVFDRMAEHQGLEGSYDLATILCYPEVVEWLWSLGYSSGDWTGIETIEQIEFL